MISPLDVVSLNVYFPDLGLSRDKKGVINDAYNSPALAYEVEFCDDEGKTIASSALSPDRLRQPTP